MTLEFPDSILSTFSTRMPFNGWFEIKSTLLDFALNVPAKVQSVIDVNVRI